MTVHPATRRVTGYEGLHGYLTQDRPDDPAQEVEVELEGGTRIVVPSGALEPDPGGGYLLPLSLGDVQRSFASQTGSRVIPIVEEQLRIEKRLVDTARVRIRKRISEHVESVNPELMREEVNVERVAVNRYVDAPVAPHQEGETLVIPLVEEVLVVEKRLLLREEIRVTKTLVPLESTPRQVALRREDVEIERIPLDTPEPNEPRR